MSAWVPRGWQLERVMTIKALVIEGHTNAQIAEQLGIGISSVARAARQFSRLRPKREDVWPEEQIDFLLQRYRQPDWTAVRISREMPGRPRSPRAVVRQAEVFGLQAEGQCGKPIHSDELRRRCLLLAAQDMTVREIAEQLGVSLTWVHDKIASNSTFYARWKDREPERRRAAQLRRWHGEKVAA